MISTCRSLVVCRSSRPFFPLGFNTNIHSIMAAAAAASMSSSTSTGTSGNSKSNVKTGILMLNMGGPSSLEEVEPFLTRLFTDTDIINMPFQRYIFFYNLSSTYISICIFNA